MSNGPVASTASGSVAKAGTPATERWFGVDRHGVEPAREHVPEHVVRGPTRVVGGADHRDPPGRREELADAVVIERLDGSATLVEVEVRDGPRAVLRGHRRLPKSVVAKSIDAAPSIAYPPSPKVAVRHRVAAI